jgi:hypothetical protein|tara:strand:+ start:55 stop:309 length:255 start_codon:yes stop_codon:yes gene_type:complete
MRQKLITLCPTSFELAGKKNNFSAWVRRKLLEDRARVIDTPSVLYGAYCEPCDTTYQNPHEDALLAFNCKKCGEDTEYLGELLQ